MKKLNIGAINCQGIKGKIDLPEFQRIVSAEDIFGVSETWLKEGDVITKLPEHIFYPLNRKKEKGNTRGVFCGVN